MIEEKNTRISNLIKSLQNEHVGSSFNYLKSLDAAMKNEELKLTVVERNALLREIFEFPVRQNGWATQSVLDEIWKLAWNHQDSIKNSYRLFCELAEEVWRDCIEQTRETEE